MQEKAILIGLITPDVTPELVDEYLLELDFLARTSGAKTVKQFTQKLPHPDNKTFLGKGKTKEVCEFVKENEIDIIIFDDELSAAQERNKIKIIPLPGPSAVTSAVSISGFSEKFFFYGFFPEKNNEILREFINVRY